MDGVDSQDSWKDCDDAGLTESTNEVPGTEIMPSQEGSQRPQETEVSGH